MSERIRNLYRNYAAILLVQTSSSANSALSD